MWNPDQPNEPEDSKQSGARSTESSALEREILTLRAKLAPPSLEQATEELLRCLRLVAIAGMSDTDRREWLLVAYDEIKEIPACEFAERCSHARKTADHVSKIVPAIFSLKFDEFHGAGQVKLRLKHREREHASRFMKKLQAAPSGAPREQFDTTKIREEMGFPSEAKKPAKRNLGPSREPTADELAELAAQFKRENRYPDA